MSNNITNDDLEIYLLDKLFDDDRVSIEMLNYLFNCGFNGSNLISLYKCCEEKYDKFVVTVNLLFAGVIDSYLLECNNKLDNKVLIIGKEFNHVLDLLSSNRDEFDSYVKLVNISFKTRLLNEIKKSGDVCNVICLLNGENDIKLVNLNEFLDTNNAINKQYGKNHLDDLVSYEFLYEDIIGEDSLSVCKFYVCDISMNELNNEEQDKMMRRVLNFINKSKK